MKFGEYSTPPLFNQARRWRKLRVIQLGRLKAEWFPALWRQAYAHRVPGMTVVCLGPLRLRLDHRDSLRTTKEETHT